MAVFANIRYWLSDSIPQERKDALAGYFTNNGAEAADGIGDATHVVTNTPQFEGWKRVEDKEIDVHVVTVNRLGLIVVRLFIVFFFTGTLGYSIYGTWKSPTACPATNFSYV